MTNTHPLDDEALDALIDCMRMAAEAGWDHFRMPYEQVCKVDQSFRQLRAERDEARAKCRKAASAPAADHSYAQGAVAADEAASLITQLTADRLLYFKTSTDLMRENLALTARVKELEQITTGVYSILKRIESPSVGVLASIRLLQEDSHD